jgi:DNA-3-methyladenine glycosylase
VKGLQTVYPEKFYRRPTLEVARDLLGAFLCRRLPDGKVLYGPIVELEAYTRDDPACHASRGKTPRCSVMFGPAGRAYVYFIYGMYYCLNVVTEPEHTPGAVLIRAVGAEGTNGPGKLCRQWEINFEHNGVSLMDPASSLWISPAKPVADQDIITTTRVGISSAQDRPWRFLLKDHESVSRPAASPKPKRK